MRVALEQLQPERERERERVKRVSLAFYIEKYDRIFLLTRLTWAQIATLRMPQAKNGKEPTSETGGENWASVSRVRACGGH